MSTKDFIKKSVMNAFVQYDAPKLAVALLAALALGILIYLVYRKFYTGVVYSRSFAVTLVGMCVLTCMVTLAISTNVVISLGMVGALSIVRFRTAIKDPMDLIFLFWSISIGIICGAGLYEVALLTCLVVTILILVLENLPASRAPMMLVVNVTDVDKEDAVLDIVKKYSKYYKVKSRNLTAGALDMVVEVRVKEESAFVKEVSAVDTVLSASLIAHDGEVTF